MLTCASCGRDNALDARFCSGCGAALATAPPAREVRKTVTVLFASGRVCPVSRIDRRVDWERINIFGGSGIGRGPAYPGLGLSKGRLTVTPDTQYGGPWAGGKVFWYVRPGYQGRVLIRGRRLNGTRYRFDELTCAG